MICYVLECFTSNILVSIFFHPHPHPHTETRALHIVPSYSTREKYHSIGWLPTARLHIIRMRHINSSRIGICTPYRISSHALLSHASISSAQQSFSHLKKTIIKMDGPIWMKNFAIRKPWYIITIVVLTCINFCSINPLEIFDLSELWRK